MSDSANPPVVDPSASGASDDKQDQPKEQTVAYDTHRRLLDEKKKVAAKLAEYEAKERLAAEEQAKKAGEHQKIIEARDALIKEQQEQLMSVKSQIENAKKLSAFMKSVGDIDGKWLGLVDVSKIAFKPESEEVDDFSLKTAVDNFRKQWPEAIKKPGSSLPNPAMPNGNGMISESEWKALKGSAEKQKYKPDQIKWGQ